VNANRLALSRLRALAHSLLSLAQNIVHLYVQLP
jgi:hypothetical protein